MKVHRWCVSVGTAFLLSFTMLLAVGTAHGSTCVSSSPSGVQCVNVWWSPTNPVSYEPITFYIQPVYASVWVHIIPPYAYCDFSTFPIIYCGGPTLVFKPEQSNMTLQSGLEAGTYGLLIETYDTGSYYYSSLKVSPTPPVSEFGGTFIAFFLSFVALYCVLGRGRRHPH